MTAQESTTHGDKEAPEEATDSIDGICSIEMAALRIDSVDVGNTGGLITIRLQGENTGANIWGHIPEEAAEQLAHDILDEVEQ